MKPATLLTNGRVVDGTGAPARVGDLLFHGDRIVAIAPSGQIAPQTLAATGGYERLDCSGKVIAPGFIDVHTHDDAAVLDGPDMLPKLSQGITTVIVGNCGISLAPVVTDTPLAPLSLLGRLQFRHASMADYARAVDAGLPVPDLARFRRDADWIGVQRHLKVIGIFARICHRDGKPKYLGDVPRFFAYIHEVLARRPELAELGELLASLPQAADVPA